MRTIIANGKPVEIGEMVTVEKFLQQHKIDTRWVVLELNGQPLTRDYYRVTPLRPGDKLEIVTPIAGG